MPHVTRPRLCAGVNFRIKPHLADREAQKLLVRDFNKLTFGRWGERFTPGMTPHQFETCDWACGHRGRTPEFWRYVKHAACHWLVNFNRRLATLAEPEREALQRYLALPSIGPLKTIAANKAHLESQHWLPAETNERIYDGLRKAGMPEE